MESGLLLPGFLRFRPRRYGPHRMKLDADLDALLSAHHPANVVNQMSVLGIERRHGERARFSGLCVEPQEVIDKSEKRGHIGIAVKPLLERLAVADNRDWFFVSDLY